MGPWRGPNGSRSPEARALASARAIGLALVAAAAVTYPLVSAEAGQPLALFALPPLVVASLTRPRPTVEIGMCALTVAAIEGALDDRLDAPSLAVRLAIIVAAVVLATLGARARVHRDEALHDATVASSELRERLQALSGALRAGRVGTWTWDSASDTVMWDADLERLFGLEPGGFEGTFDAWIARVHPDDRARCLALLQQAATDGDSFSFEHRCVWPDCSVHWLEGVGQTVTDAATGIVGAAGVTADIDDRRTAEDDRRRALALERRAAERSSYLASASQALSSALDVGELVERITASAVPAIADWCRLTLVLDDGEAIVRTAVAHPDPDVVALTRWLEEQHPFRPEARTGAARVIRTGETVFQPVIVDAMIDATFHDPQLSDTLKRLGMRSVITVPLRDPRGVAGALQLVRTADSPVYTRTTSCRAGAGDHDRRGAAQRPALPPPARRARGARPPRAVLGAARARGHGGRHRGRHDRARHERPGGQRGHVVPGAGRRAAPRRPRRLRGRRRRGVAHRAARSIHPDRRGAHHRRARRDHVRGLDDGALRGAGRAPRIGDRAAAPHPAGARRCGRLRVRCAPSLRGRGADDAVDPCGALCGRHRTGSAVRGAARRVAHAAAPHAARAPARAAVVARRRALPTGHRCEVGGDWYQVLHPTDGTVIAVLGDAVGRGIPAAAAMGQLRGVITGAAGVEPDPARIIDAADRFAHLGEDTTAASMSCVRIDPQADRIQYLSAGHLPPIVLREDGTVELLTEWRRPLLGVVEPDGAGTAAVTTFAPGDTLLLYSDGLVERRTETIDDGLQRLCRLLRGLGTQDLSPDELCDRVVRELTGDRVIADDVAVLVARRTA